MAKMAPVDLRRLAVVGARARLMELKAEMASLVRAFPEISRAGGATVGALVVRRAKPWRNTPMTAAERSCEVSVGNWREGPWAARRAARGKK